MTHTNRPLLVDLDSGYGNPQKTFHVARSLFQLGATAVCIEDYGASKVSSLIKHESRRLNELDEQLKILHAAASAASQRQDDGRRTFVIARTECLVCGGGEDELLRRVEAYVNQGGAEAIFIQNTNPDVDRFCGALAAVRRLLGNTIALYVAPTCYPSASFRALWEAGATHIILANYVLRAVYGAVDDILMRAESCTGAHELDARVTSYQTIVETTLKNWRPS